MFTDLTNVIESEIAKLLMLCIVYLLTFSIVLLKRLLKSRGIDIERIERELRNPELGDSAGNNTGPSIDSNSQVPADAKDKSN